MGKALLHHAEAAARAAGHTELHLASTQTAQRFYLRNGFQATGQVQLWHGLQSQPMRKLLAVV